MKLISIRHAFVAAVLIVVASAVGCQEKSGNVGQPATTAQAGQIGPKESFQMIVETFRRGVEDVEVGFVVRDDAGGHSMLTGRNEVTHQLIPPTKKGDPYKGVITVESQSRYSMQRSTEETEANGDEQAGNESGNSQALSEDDFGVEILDPDLVSAPGARGQSRRASPGKGEKNGVTVARKENENVRTYELVYENGRWKLVTSLDPKTEKSIQFAFEQALESQS